jgi:hypothetical protein
MKTADVRKIYLKIQMMCDVPLLRVQHKAQETFLYDDIVSVVFITRFMLIKEVLKSLFSHGNFVMKEEKTCRYYNDLRTYPLVQKF